MIESKWTKVSEMGFSISSRLGEWRQDFEDKKVLRGITGVWYFQ